VLFRVPQAGCLYCLLLPFVSYRPVMSPSASTGKRFNSSAIVLCIGMWNTQLDRCMNGSEQSPGSERLLQVCSCPSLAHHVHCSLLLSSIQHVCEINRNVHTCCISTAVDRMPPLIACWHHAGITSGILALCNRSMRRSSAHTSAHTIHGLPYINSSKSNDIVPAGCMDRPAGATLLLPAACAVSGGSCCA
jgi:hypothetical protein